MLVVLLVLAVIGGGTLLTYQYDKCLPPLVRLSAGAMLGFTLFSLSGFAFASLWGLNAFTLLLSGAIASLPSLSLMRQNYRAAIRADVACLIDGFLRCGKCTRRSQVIGAVYWSALSILLWDLFAHTLYVRPEGWYTGVVNNLGDMPFHLGIISGFISGGNYPPQHPEMAGTRLTYHFLVDFLAAMLVRAGASVPTAIFVENMLLAASLVVLLHHWAWTLTRDRLVAYLTPVLVLLSGGLGWWLLLGDARATDHGIFSLIAQPPHDYTIQVPQDAGLRWGNALTTLILPQRSLLMGLPLLLIVCTLWWQAMEERQKEESREVEEKEADWKGSWFYLAGGQHSAPQRRMLAAGVITGLLPLIHAQSFVALMGMGACLALLTRQWRLWLSSLTLATALAVPQLLWLMRGSATHGHDLLTWHWGWDKGDAGFVWFWFKNTGLFIPLLLVALLWRGREPLVPPRLRLFYLPFTLCFIVPNVLKLEPWVWDTIKILFLWFLAATPLVALLLARLWRRPPFRWRLLPSRALAAALLLSLTLSGGLDVWRVASGATEFQEFDAGGLALAGLIERATPVQALILGAPTYNHPVMLTGRRLLMGYAGHLWSQGIDCGPRNDAVHRIYAGAPDAQALLDANHVQYMVVGPLERANLPVNDGFFQTFPRVGEAGGYVLYKNPHLP